MVDLREYNSLHTVRMVRDLVRMWWNLEVSYADSEGYALDHADGIIPPSSNPFCNKALHSKDGFHRCNESLKTTSQKLRGDSSRTSLTHQCHLGFQIAAAPIYLHETYVGFIFASGSAQAPVAGNNKEELLGKVREFAAAAEPELVHQVPIVDGLACELLEALLAYAAKEIATAHHERHPQPSQTSTTTIPKIQKSFGDIVGAASSMHSLFRLLEKVTRSEATVLIHGESGTGKELIARAIHYHGPRADKPFVVQNCSAFNDNLLESALFGHCRGSFTGAVKDQKGLFETAHGGTFFLDEIGDMSPSLQVKLLRVLQEGTLTPVGATKPVKVDVRIVAASHKDLAQMVKAGTFREDLYYRINVLKISVPPLRERIEDLPMLVTHFLQKHYRHEGSPPVVSDEAMEALAAYHWPGNIRELENEMERLTVLATPDGPISPSLLSHRITENLQRTERPKPASQGTTTLRSILEKVEAEVIEQGLIRTHWNKSQLAKELGISRSNLIQKCHYYGLEAKP